MIGNKKKNIAKLLILLLIWNISFQSLEANGLMLNLKDNKEVKKDDGKKINRFIIKYKDKSSEKDNSEKSKSKSMVRGMFSAFTTKKSESLVEEIGDNIKEKIKLNDEQYEMIVTEEEVSEEEIKRLAENDSSIEFIQPDYKLKLDEEDVYYDQQWGLRYINGQNNVLFDLNNENTTGSAIHNNNTTGSAIFNYNNTTTGAVKLDLSKLDLSEVLVGVIDSGIEINHEDLKNKIWKNNREIIDGMDNDGNGYIDDINGWNFIDNNPIVYQDEDKYINHGTHVAGIIGSQENNGIGIKGMAPNVKIVPLKVFRDGEAYTSDVIRAIQYAEANGIKIVNCSWGSNARNEMLQEAMENSDILFVVAAGNKGRNIDKEGYYPAAYESDNIITVGSIDRNGERADDSNFGRYSVDVFAPGEDILSTIPKSTYTKKSGTSMAAAFVTGEAAIIKGLNNRLPIKDIKDIIIESAVNIYGNKNEKIIELSKLDEMVKNRKLVDSDWFKNRLFLYEIFNKYSKIDEIPEKEIDKLMDILDFNKITAIKVESFGFKLNEAVDIATEIKQSKINSRVAEYLLTNNRDGEEIIRLILDLDGYKRWYDLDAKEFEFTQMKYIEGYPLLNIVDAINFERITGIDKSKIISKVTTKEHDEKIEDYVNYFNEDIKDQIVILIKMFNIRYDILKEHCGKNEITIEEIVKRIREYYEKNRLELSGENEEEGKTKVEYDKYLAAPFQVASFGNESISPNSGDLSFIKNLYSNSGRNNLGLDLTLKYSGSESGLYEPDIDSSWVDMSYYRVSVTGIGYSDIKIGGKWFGYDRDRSLDCSWVEYFKSRKSAEEYKARYSGTKYNTGGNLPNYKEKIEFSSTIEKIYDGYYNYYTSKEEITTLEKYSQLGTGWKFNISRIEKSDGNEYLVLGSGENYKINFTSQSDDSNLEKYTLKDKILRKDSGFSSDGVTSKYALEYLGGTKEYFAEDGRLLSRIDRYNNKILFKYKKVNGFYLINKIIDTIGREVTIDYGEFQNNQKRVTINLPDGNNIVLVSEKIQDDSNDYVLKEIIGKDGLKTSFDYYIQEAGFSLTGKNVAAAKNKFANLKSISYSTGGKTQYKYNKTIGNMGNSGQNEYYRVVERKDINEGNQVNIVSFNYGEDNNTGYPNNKDPKKLPDNYEYHSFMQSGDKKEKLTFNKDHLLINKKTYSIKGGTEKLLSEEITSYNKDKLPSENRSKLYGYNGDEINTSNPIDTISTVEYDDYGDVTKEVDIEGKITKYQYDDKYHILKVVETQISKDKWSRTENKVDPNTGNILWTLQKNTLYGVDKSLKIEFTKYDTFGNLLQKEMGRSDGKRSVEKYEYSPEYGQAYLTKKSVKVTDFNGSERYVTEECVYDRNTGNLLNQKGANGQITTYQYDVNGRIIKEIYPNNTSKSVQYDDTNNNVKLTLENGHKLKYTYDQIGRLKKKEQLGDKSTSSNEIWDVIESYEYLPQGELKRATDTWGNSVTYEYDVFGRITKSINPDGTFRRTKYYDTKNEKIDIDEVGNEHYTKTDLVGRVTQEKFKEDDIHEIISSNVYDFAGNLIKTVDFENNITKFKYDDLGKLIKVTDAKNDDTNYIYDNMGNLIKTIKKEYDTKFTEGGNIITEKVYDELGRVIIAYRPYKEGVDEREKADKFLYDAIGNIKLSTDPSGQKIEYGFDNMNRTITKKYYRSNKTLESTVNFDYSKLESENKMEVTDSNGVMVFEYFKNGKLKSESMPNNTNKKTSYEYYRDGNLKNITDPFGLKTEYTYTNKKLIDKIKVGDKEFDYDYYANGMMKSLVYPNKNIRTDFSYTGTNKLKSLVNKVKWNSDSFRYQYDKNGNTDIVNHNGSEYSYDYDELDRLIKIKRPNEDEINITFDAIGNRRSLRSNKIQDIDSLLGDDNLQHKYNTLNQLIEFKTGSDVYRYKYDHKGMRISKTHNNDTTKYLYNQQSQVITELDGNNKLKAQTVWGHKALARRIFGKMYYYLYNGHGDVVQMVDENGNTVNEYEYDEWGNIKEKRETIDNPLKYAGEIYDDESGYYYLRARYYDPKVGRFISKDTYEGDIRNPMTLNQYVYCFNNPWKYVDPSGHWPKFGNLMKGVLAVTVGVIAIGTAVVAAPAIATTAGAIAVATTLAGATAVTMGTADIYEHFTGKNIIKEKVFKGNAKAYNAVEYGAMGLSIAGAGYLWYYAMAASRMINEGASEAPLKINLQLFAEDGTKSWIKRDVFKQVQGKFGKDAVQKFANSMKKGIVGGKGENGIKLLKGNNGLGAKVGGNYYKYQVKVKGKFGDWRLFGNFDEETGHIIFDLFEKGLH